MFKHRDRGLSPVSIIVAVFAVFFALCHAGEGLEFCCVLCCRTLSVFLLLLNERKSGSWLRKNKEHKFSALYWAF